MLSSIADEKQRDLKGGVGDQPRIKTMQLGVWRLLLCEDDEAWLALGWARLNSSFDILSQLVQDVYSLGPMPFVTLVLAKLFRGFKPPLFLYQSNQILNFVGNHAV
jgi:hypothetical protein